MFSREASLACCFVRPRTTMLWLLSLSRHQWRPACEWLHCRRCISDPVYTRCVPLTPKMTVMFDIKPTLCPTKLACSVSPHMLLAAHKLWHPRVESGQLVHGHPLDRLPKQRGVRWHCA